MCYTCGCDLPFEDHGDPRNIIESAFREAGATKESKGGGTLAAKKNMLALLNAEQDRGELAEPRESYAERTPKA